MCSCTYQIFNTRFNGIPTRYLTQGQENSSNSFFHLFKYSKHLSYSFATSVRNFSTSSLYPSVNFWAISPLTFTDINFCHFLSSSILWIDSKLISTSTTELLALSTVWICVWKTGISECKCHRYISLISLKSTSVSVCFRGISRLPSAFVFLRWFKLAHIFIQVCTFYDGCKQGIDQLIFNRKSISRKITHPQSWKLQAKLTGEKLKGWSNNREKLTQDYNQNFITQAHKS